MTGRVSSIPARSGPAGSAAPLLALAGVTLAGWMAVALQPRLLSLVGILDYGLWFLDTHAVLSANDAVASGLDPARPNPLDHLGRPHSYSDWWFVLGWAGLGRAHNFGVGLAWVAGFLATALWALRPRDWPEMAVAALLLLSPPVLLAVQRGNNDLVIFALLAAAGGLLRAAERWRWLAAGGLIGLATGLKFYPAAAAGVFLLVPGRRKGPALVWAAAGVAAVLWSVWPAVGRGFFAILPDVHKVGAGILLADLGLTEPGWRVLAGAVVAGGGLALAAGGFAGWSGADEAAHLQARAWFTLAAAVLVGSFLVGIGYAYRWIFLLLLPAWLWRCAPVTPRARLGRSVLWALLAGLVWADGLFCLVLNLGFMPRPQTDVDAWMKTWRLLTQPLHWVLMVWLCAWLWTLLPVPAQVRKYFPQPLSS